MPILSVDGDESSGPSYVTHPSTKFVNFHQWQQIGQGT
jgi:hypothetical protein